jgi:hypothetical protein
MTFAETILTLRGHQNSQAREWEKYRLVAYQVYTSIPKKGPNKSIQQYFPLPTDNNGKKLDANFIKARRQAFLDKMAKN